MHCHAQIEYRHIGHCWDLQRGLLVTKNYAKSILGNWNRRVRLACCTMTPPPPLPPFISGNAPPRCIFATRWKSKGQQKASNPLLPLFQRNPELVQNLVWKYIRGERPFFYKESFARRLVFTLWWETWRENSEVVYFIFLVKPAGNNLPFLWSGKIGCCLWVIINPVLYFYEENIVIAYQKNNWTWVLSLKFLLGLIAWLNGCLYFCRI